MWPEFQNTMTWGAVLQILSTVVICVGGFYAIRTDISVIKNNIYHLEKTQETLTEAFSQLGKILTSVAVQDTRIAMVEKKIDELAHGEGIVAKRK